MKEGDEFSMIFFKLLILLRSLIKLQPQRRDFDAAMAGEENAFVFAAWLYFLFVFRVTNTLSQDKSKFLMLSPFPHLSFAWSPSQKQHQCKRLIMKGV